MHKVVLARISDLPFQWQAQEYKAYSIPGVFTGGEILVPRATAIQKGKESNS